MISTWLGNLLVAAVFVGIFRGHNRDEVNQLFHFVVVEAREAKTSLAQ